MLHAVLYIVEAGPYHSFGDIVPPEEFPLEQIHYNEEGGWVGDEFRVTRFELAWNGQLTQRQLDELVGHFQMTLQRGEVQPPKVRVPHFLQSEAACVYTGECEDAKLYVYAAPIHDLRPANGKVQAPAPPRPRSE